MKRGILSIARTFRTVLTSAAVTAAISTAAVTATGCADTPADTNGPSEVNLSALLPAGAQPVGVAVSPEGKRYVLDRLSGLYELSDGSAKLVFKTSDLVTRYKLPADLDLTDVVALGNEQFAITAENDGFRLDLHGGTFTSYFCYLPGALPSDGVPVEQSISQTLQLQGIAVKQRTESVAFNLDSQLLFAQPRTIRMDTGAVAGSELFVFGAGGGEPIQVRPIANPAFVAEGMVAVAGDRLLLGSGHSIFEATPFTSTPILVKDLPIGIQIGGMARQPDGSLLLLDRAANRLLVVPAP